jgi:uncharacterized protein (TIGR02466 family)
MKALFNPLFTTPLMKVHLDLDLEKLTEFAFEMWNKDKKGVQISNKGGWQSDNIIEERHEEFIKLKKEINQYLQQYHSEVFRGMEFKGNVVHNINNMWANINEKHNYNEWHIHGGSTLSGVFYIKHDNSSENGDILFKHPNSSYYMVMVHWPPNIIEKTNEVSSEIINIKPKSNMLLIFPSWLEHKVEPNLKNVSRISVSFNSTPILEKKS